MKGFFFRTGGQNFLIALVQNKRQLKNCGKIQKNDKYIFFLNVKKIEEKIEEVLNCGGIKEINSWKVQRKHFGKIQNKFKKCKNCGKFKKMKVKFSKKIVEEQKKMVGKLF